MKNLKLFATIIAIVIMAFFSSGCRVIHSHQQSNTVIIKQNPNGKIPPGQLKRVTGEKSAKKYAPGQNKKSKKKR
jgi:hypothetical protein